MRFWPLTISFTLAIVLTLTLPAQAQQEPFTQEQVQGMVQSGLADETGAKAIDEQGIDCMSTEDFLQSLNSAGASETFLAALRGAKHPEEATQPLNKNQLLDLVKFGMNGAKLVEKMKGLGIDFEPTEDYLDALLRAGAQEAVIGALLEKPKPLTKEQVGKLVAGGVPSERAARLVRQRGIDFEADEQYLDTLRVAGADDALIGSLRAASAVAAAALEEDKLRKFYGRLESTKSFRHLGMAAVEEKADREDRRAADLGKSVRDPFDGPGKKGT